MPNDILTYNGCLICGGPFGSGPQPMNIVRRFWDADDGWRIGALCSWCWKDAKSDRPKPEDYAYEAKHDVCTGEVETDEDVTAIL